MQQNQLSRYGAISRVIPELSPSGRVFLVGDSDDTTYGVTALGNDYPVDNQGVVRVYSTVQNGVNACDSRGDVVLVAPYHTENFTVVDTWDVAGVQVIGMGKGDARPSLTFNSATASVNLGASGIRVSNLIFLASADSIARALDMDTGFFGQRVDNCLFTTDAGTDDFRVCIRAGAKESIIEDNQFLMQDTAGAGRAISIVGGDPDHLVIRRNYIYGQYDTVGDTTNGAAPIAIDTTDTSDTNLSGIIIEDNVVINTDTAASMMMRIGGETIRIRGMSRNNYFASYDSGTADTSKFALGLAAGTGLRMINNFLASADTDALEKRINDSFVELA